MFFIHVYLESRFCWSAIQNTNATFSRKPQYFHSLHEISCILIL